LSGGANDYAICSLIENGSDVQKKNGPKGQVLDALAQLAPLSGLPKACQADKLLVHDVPENVHKGRLAHRRFFLHGAKVWPAG